mgnify:CR=1 FL=1
MRAGRRPGRRNRLPAPEPQLTQKYLRLLSALQRRTKIELQLGLDAILVALSFLGAMLFRLEDTAFRGRPGVWLALVPTVAAALLAFPFLGL